MCQVFTKFYFEVSMKTERQMQQNYCKYCLSCKRKNKAVSGVVLPINTEAVKEA